MKTVFPSKKFWNQFGNRFEIYKSMVPLFKRSKNLIVETVNSLPEINSSNKIELC